MADTRINALTTLAAGALASGDLFVLVDVSDSTMAASGTDKNTTAAALGLVATVVQSMMPPIASAPASSVTGSVNQYYSARIRLLGAATLTGIRYRVGGTSNGNVRSELFAAADLTAAVANRTTDSAQATALTAHAVGFDSTYSAFAGDYVAVVWFSSATATFMGGRFLGGTGNGTQASNTPTSVSAPATENSDRPIVALY